MASKSPIPDALEAQHEARQFRMDSLITATAIAHGLTVATRNRIIDRFAD